MKRRELLRHLRQHGFVGLCGKVENTPYGENPATNRGASVPRHSELPEFTVVGQFEAAGGAGGHTAARWATAYQSAK